MATHSYSLPQVDPDSTLSFPDAVNGVGIATDAVLHGIQEGFSTVAYELPIASSETLGGVRVGDGFRVYSDGTLTTAAEKFKLKPATNDTLGGVVIGKNVTVDGSGKIGVGAGAFASVSVGTNELAPSAVTGAKIADFAIGQTQLSSNAYNALSAVDRVWLNASKLTLAPSAYVSNFDQIVLYKVTDNMWALAPNIRQPAQSYNFFDNATKTDWADLWDADTQSQLSPASAFTETFKVCVEVWGGSPAKYAGTVICEINGATAKWRRTYIGSEPGAKAYRLGGLMLVPRSI